MNVDLTVAAVVKAGLEDREALDGMRDDERLPAHLLAPLFAPERLAIRLPAHPELAEWIADQTTGGAIFGRFDLAVDAEVERLEVREAAAERRASQRSAGRVRRPVRSLVDVLAEPDPEQAWRIEGWLPAGGTVGLFAPRKTGKSHVVGSLVRSAADGMPFLDRFAAEPVDRVTLVDLELGMDRLRAWLREQGVQHPERVDLVDLRGAGRDFDITNPAGLAWWIDRLRGTDLLIVDPARPLMDALKVKEREDVGPLTDALDALKAGAGIRELLLVHHTGWSGEHARGDSRLEDWPDELWRLSLEDERNERSPRYLGTYGRETDQVPGRVDQEGRRLVWRGGTKTDSKGSALLDEVLGVLREQDPEPMSFRALRDALLVSGEGHKDAEARAGIKYAVGKNRVLTKRQGRAVLHSLAPQVGVQRA